MLSSLINARRSCFDSFQLVSFPVCALIRAKKRSRSRGIFSLTFLEERATILARNPNNSVCYINSIGTIMPPAVVTLHSATYSMQSSLSQPGWLPKMLQSPWEILLPQNASNLGEKLCKQIEISEVIHAGESCIPFFVCIVFSKGFFHQLGMRACTSKIDVLRWRECSRRFRSDSTISGPGNWAWKWRLKQKLQGIGLPLVSSKRCFSFKLNSWQPHCTDDRVKVQNTYRRTNKIKSPFEQWQHSIIVSMLL